MEPQFINARAGRLEQPEQGLTSCTDGHRPSRPQNLGPGQLIEVFPEALAVFRTLAAQPATGHRSPVVDQRYYAS